MREKDEYCITAGEFAKICQTTRDTLRYYERQGILVPKKNPVNGYHYYSYTQISSYYFIRTFRGLDCSVGDIREYLLGGEEIRFDEFVEQQYEKLLYMRKELDQKIDKISVYARVSPENKIRIVEGWQRRGNIVSMTGDGVNDAPALKKADIGVAMGITGTEVSKDAAAMILADDNFATIIKAVANGRNVYRNIKNAVLYLLSGNTAAIFAVLYTSLMALPVPFAPVQLLFINLLTDSLPALAIGMEPADEGLLKEKPRDPKEGLMTKDFMIQMAAQGVLIAAVVITAFYLGLRSSTAMASTMAFSTLTLARLFHGFNCRGKKSIFKLGFGTNPYSLYAFGAGALLLGLVIFIPGLHRLFQVQSMPVVSLLQVAVLAFIPTLMIQMKRLICKK